MNIKDLIASKRDGHTHTEEELRWLAQAAADGSVPDYQLSAWLMAAYIKSLNPEETAWLTRGMAESGERLDLSDLPEPRVDKHSTGGVGDKTTLVLLPLLASVGLTIVKMSGRGLGVTGGTVDKLSSIPGFNLNLSPEEMKAQAKKIGLGWSGQTPDLAPADKALYSLRDATATVTSIPLIVASILSKKIAAGAETVVLDVKCGSGAFMNTYEEAQSLAWNLSATAKFAGLKTRLMITDMSQPLGTSVGNALEVMEAADVLAGKQNSRVRDLCVELAALAMSATGLEPDYDKAKSIAGEKLDSGDALKKAEQWMEAQCASPKVLTDHSMLPQAAVKHEVVYKGMKGWIEKFDAETVGRAVIALGGGRLKKEDEIDPSVGVTLSVAVGDEVEEGKPLFTVHAKSEEDAKAAEESIMKGIEVSSARVQVPPIIRAWL